MGDTVQVFSTTATTASAGHGRPASGADTAGARTGCYVSAVAPGTPEKRSGCCGGSAAPSRPTARGLRRRLLPACATRKGATRIGCVLVSALTLLLADAALAQKPGRYTQADIAATITPGLWFCEFRVQSADVLEDKSIRINLILTSKQDGGQATLIFNDLRKIQLISDSLDRVAVVGRPEGRFLVDSDGRITLAARESIKLSLKFPALPEETKRVNLIFYAGSVAGADAFQLRGIALFAKE